MVKKVLIGIGIILGLGVVTVGGYLGYLTVKDYRPEQKVVLDIEDRNKSVIKVGEELNVVTSNIGYGGMDKDVHFFLDGGSMSRGISKERVIYNINRAYEVLEKYNPDIVLFQEVDLEATRSYNVNQYEMLMQKYKDFDSSVAINFDVPWLALPLTEPHGKVLAGQVSFSNKNILSSERLALPIDETWPQRLAGLDRALLVTRLEVENGKELVVVNVHCSAYDKGGQIRKLQGEMISRVLEEEYKKGNYVIIGGDWNQAIPGSDASIFETKEEWPEWLVEVPETFKPEGFQWVFDKNVATCRNAGKEYVEGYNFLSIIDGFIVSDNIEVVNVEGINTNFEYSDHNPVKTTIKLK